MIKINAKIDFGDELLINHHMRVHTIKLIKEATMISRKCFLKIDGIGCLICHCIMCAVNWRHYSIPSLSLFECTLKYVSTNVLEHSQNITFFIYSSISSKENADIYLWLTCPQLSMPLENSPITCSTYT